MFFFPLWSRMKRPFPFPINLLAATAVIGQYTGVSKLHGSKVLRMCTLKLPFPCCSVHAVAGRKFWRKGDSELLTQAFYSILYFPNSIIATVLRACRGHGRGRETFLHFPLMFSSSFSFDLAWNGQSPFPINFLAAAAVCFSSLMQWKWERRVSEWEGQAAGSRPASDWVKGSAKFQMRLLWRRLSHIYQRGAIP